jgi:hypothetical protein
MTLPGTVIAGIAAGVATDALGNPNTAGTSTDNTVDWDAVSPSVTINQAAGQSDPTGTAPVHFTVVFSEPVTGFSAGTDVTLTGTAVPVTAVITETAPNNGTTYDVAVSGMTGSGTVIASIAAGVAADAAGNLNSPGSSTDNTVTWDVTALSVTINQAAGQADPTNTAPVNFTVEFSKAVSDFTTGDATLRHIQSR